jgi:hypothetical protein
MDNDEGQHDQEPTQEPPSNVIVPLEAPQFRPDESVITVTRRLELPWLGDKAIDPEDDDPPALETSDG